jgi:hypothetical protein
MVWAVYMERSLTSPAEKQAGGPRGGQAERGEGYTVIWREFRQGARRPASPGMDRVFWILGRPLFEGFTILSVATVLGSWLRGMVYAREPLE